MILSPLAAFLVLALPINRQDTFPEETPKAKLMMKIASTRTARDLSIWWRRGGGFPTSAEELSLLDDIEQLVEQVESARRALISYPAASPAHAELSAFIIRTSRSLESYQKEDKIFQLLNLLSSYERSQAVETITRGKQLSDRISNLSSKQAGRTDSADREEMIHAVARLKARGLLLGHPHQKMNSILTEEEFRSTIWSGLDLMSSVLAEYGHWKGVQPADRAHMRLEFLMGAAEYLVVTDYFRRVDPLLYRRALAIHGSLMWRKP